MYHRVNWPYITLRFVCVSQRESAIYHHASCLCFAPCRPALQLLRSSTSPVVSSLFFMLLPDKVLAYADCAVVPDPNP